jgi:branched-chain amino acid transport system ATP-binding protein
MSIWGKKRMSELLELTNVGAGYANARILHGVNLSVSSGMALALLGRNGVGKTTLLKTIVGLTRQTSGIVKLDGRDLNGLAPESRVEAGIGWVPQERGIFKSLTVEENLTAIARPGNWTIEAAYTMFPRLRERRKNLGNQLSGGEQQMLAIARALVLNPKILLLDEPTEGLAPVIVEELLSALTRIIRDGGLAAIVVEQHAHQILRCTDTAIILDRGWVVYSGTSKALSGDAHTLTRYLGVGADQTHHIQSGTGSAPQPLIPS